MSMAQKSMAGQMSEKKQTVCRAFAFINYNIPPAPDSGVNIGKKEAFFTTIGFFDAMKTERLDDSSLCGMWKKNEEFAMALDGRYSFQSTLGIREGNGEADDAFWADDADHPLTFVTFFQMQGKSFSARASSSKNLPQMCTLETLEECAADAVRAVCQRHSLDASSICFVSYMTLDKNDFIVGIKTDRFKIVSELILEIHRALKQKSVPTLYSYSIFSVNFSLLSQDPDQAEWIQKLREQQEKIDTICFKGIGNTHIKEESFEYLYECYAKCLNEWLYRGEKQPPAECCGRLYEIIGDYDFQYIARDVPLVNLLRAMYPGDSSDPGKSSGPLYYGSNILRNTLYASLLVLNNDAGNAWKGEDHDVQRLYASAPPPPRAERCEELRDALEQVALRKGIMTNHRFGLGTSYEDAIKSTTIGSLSKLLSSLAALERAPTRKYDFETMYWPCRRLIEVLFDDRSNCHESWEDFNSLSEFIKSLSSTLHGTLRTDIQFFQINDFNAIVHYAPAKLRAFYSAWVYNLVRYYQCFSDGADQKKYEFIIAPSNSSMILTRELTCRRNEPLADVTRGESGRHKLLKVGQAGYRLMYVEMPERLLYQPEYSCIILAHEIAHFGGGRAKRRIPSDCVPCDTAAPDDRFTVFLGCVSAWYALMYHSFLITELHKRACNGNADARLLRNILSAYLDTFQDKGRYAIEKTDLYQSIFRYLKENCALDSGYAWECINSVQVALWNFVGNPVPGQRFSAATLASRHMELNLRKWLLLAYQDSAQRAEFTENEPISWTQASITELLDRLHESCQNLENGLYTVITVGLQLGSPQIVKRIMNWIQEPHADLVGIFSLRLSPEQYFNSFLLSNTFPSAWGGHTNARDNFRSSRSRFVFMRILAVVTAMKRLTASPWQAGSVPMPEKAWNAWQTLDWHHPLSESNVPASVRTICAKLHSLWEETQMDDRCYLMLGNLLVTQDPQNESEPDVMDMATFQDIMYASQSILEQIVSYLVGCGREFLHGPPKARDISENLSSVYQCIFEADDRSGAAGKKNGGSVYRQAMAIDQMLWRFEKEQIQHFDEDPLDLRIAPAGN